MSLFKEERIECRFCRRKLPVTVHHSINVGLHPEHKQKVLDLSLFRFRCPHCGKTDILYYPTLYHDPEQRLMIQVFWREEDFGQPLDAELRTLIEIMGQKDYRRREVFGYAELVEKIRIFDAGLDDFAIALLKTVHKLEHPEVQTLFTEKTGDELYFMRVGEEGALPEALVVNTEAYERGAELAGKLRKPHDDYESLRVDENYFYDAVAASIRQDPE